MIQEARQGHKYKIAGGEFLALSSGPRPRVARIVESCGNGLSLAPWFEVDAFELEPLPMVYFHGAVPA